MKQTAQTASVFALDFRLDSRVLTPEFLAVIGRRLGKDPRCDRQIHCRTAYAQFPYSILTVTDECQNRPFVLLSRRRASITTWQSSGICFFADLSKIDYYAMCCLLALTQLKSLSMNPLLEPEDLQCESNRCLFGDPGIIEEYAFVFEDRCVCRGCFDFYHCLGADTEILFTRELLTMY